MSQTTDFPQDNVRHPDYGLGGSMNCPHIRTVTSIQPQFLYCTDCKQFITRTGIRHNQGVDMPPGQPMFDHQGK